MRCGHSGRHGGRLYLTLGELGAAAFFVTGITQARLGPSAPWFVLVAVMIGFVVRLLDAENWALFIPGGLAGRVNEAFGRRRSMAAVAAALLERLLFAALAGIVAGRYVVTGLATLFGTALFERQTGVGDVTSLAAVLLIGVIWLRTRLGQPWSVNALGRWAWLPVVVLVAVSLWGLSSYAAQFPGLPPVAPPAPDVSGLLDAILIGLAGVGIALPAVGGSTAVTRRASELQQPRLRSLQHLITLGGIFSLLVTAATAFAFGGLVPDHAQAQWWSAPLLGLISYSAGPAWLRGFAVSSVSFAGVIILAYAAQAALGDAEAILARLSQQGLVSGALRLPHPRFGTLARLADAAALAVVVIVLTSSGRVPWIASAYSVLFAIALAFSIASLVRLRVKRAKVEPGAIRPRADATHSVPSWGLMAIGTLVAISAAAMLTIGEAGAWTGLSSFIALGLVLSTAARRLEAAPPDDLETIQLLPPIDLSLENVDVRPGNIVVAVRHPHSLGHLAAALQHVGDSDVVVMTARLLGNDVPDDGVIAPAGPTADERFLFSQVTGSPSDSARSCTCSSCPAPNVFDAVVASVVRLQSSEVYVGESVTLSADDQARLLGEAWERVDKPRSRNTSGSSSITAAADRKRYFLGAHAPTLQTQRSRSRFTDLWLDAAKTIGPHVHHHDVVRAALTQMEQQLNGPHREEALDAIREVARPADELAAVVRSRDFAQLRDMMRNRPPQRPGRHARAVSPSKIRSSSSACCRARTPPRCSSTSRRTRRNRCSRRWRRKTSRRLLNDMAPDDRTMFLEELPGGGHPPAAVAPHAGRTGGRGHAARLSRRRRSGV